MLKPQDIFTVDKNSYLKLLLGFLSPFVMLLVALSVSSVVIKAILFTLAVALILFQLLLLIALIKYYFEYKQYVEDLETNPPELKENEQIIDYSFKQSKDLLSKGWTLDDKGNTIGKIPKNIKNIKIDTPYNPDELKLEQEAYTGEEYNVQ